MNFIYSTINRPRLIWDARVRKMDAQASLKGQRPFVRRMVAVTDAKESTALAQLDYQHHFAQNMAVVSDAKKLDAVARLDYQQHFA